MGRGIRLIAAILLSLVAAAAVRAPAAAADTTTSTVTIRGAIISTAAPEADTGALVVLRGSRPPPAPPPPRAPPSANACPAGYVELAGGDCMPADYVGQPDDVWGWPYVAGGRHQRRATHRPGRRAVGLARGAVSSGGAVHR